MRLAIARLRPRNRSDADERAESPAFPLITHHWSLVAYSAMVNNERESHIVRVNLFRVCHRDFG